MRHAVLVTFLYLFAVCFLSAQTNKFEADIRAFEATDRTDPPPKGAVLFVGSSSIRFWKTLADDFPGHRVINRGFGGSHMSDVVHFTQRIVIPYRPRLIVVYAGGNDIHSGKTPEAVLADFKTFVAMVRAALPGTPIAYISIAPNPARWAQVDKVRAANSLIADYAQRQRKVEFIDVFSQMLGSDGKPRPEIYSDDRLHMNAHGYALWTRIIKRHL